MLHIGNHLVVVGGMMQGDVRVSDVLLFNLELHTWQVLDVSGLDPTSAHTLIRPDDSSILLYGGSDHTHGLRGKAIGTLLRLQCTQDLSLKYHVARWVVRHSVPYL
eukprot:NODE_482_length_1699_cov_79.846061_g401_i0.p2 GENE.NODE_482_length_1699_cov_79.846061_g401_i0~~NODE_482_length_1699_cov_79.846061_g401_i0.p2  ORF type:complete len:106 (-),score=14.86 NODE_482_length_1699_cov_79.846061_g401_i0:88-405(-)